MGIFGSLSGSKTKQKSTTTADYWTPEQHEAAKSLFTNYLQPRIGQGLPSYTGRLPGTSGPSAIQSNVFRQAQEGTGAFGAYSRVFNPEEWQKRTNERVASYDILNKPIYEAEDTALKERLANMGLSDSSDIVKKRMDVAEQRAAQRQAFAQSIYDAYEKLGLEVAPQAIQSLTNVGEMQRQITEAGLGAQFQEWLRTQPEYSPVIEQLLTYLGLRGEATTTTTGSASESGWKLGATWTPEKGFNA